LNGGLVPSRRTVYRRYTVEDDGRQAPVPKGLIDVVFEEVKDRVCLYVREAAVVGLAVIADDDPGNPTVKPGIQEKDGDEAEAPGPVGEGGRTDDDGQAPPDIEVLLAVKFPDPTDDATFQGMTGPSIGRTRTNMTAPDAR